MEIARTALNHLRGRSPAVLVLVAISAAAAQLEAAALVLVALTIESLASGKDQVAIDVGPLAEELPVSTVALTSLVLFLVAAGTAGGFVVLQARNAASVGREYRDLVVTSYAASEWETQSQQRTGRLTGQLKLTNAAPVTFIGLTAWGRAVVTVGVLLVAAILVSLSATLTALTVAVAFAVVVRPLRRRLRTLVERATKVELGFAEEFGEGVEMSQELRVFGAWDGLVGRLKETTRTLEGISRRVLIHSASLPLAYQYGGPLVVFGVVATLSAFPSLIGLGSLAAVALLLLRSVQYGQQLQSATQLLVENVAVLGALHEDLAAAHSTPQTGGGKTLASLDHIALRNVKYSYPGSASCAIKDISLEISRGDSVGVVGPSGSGKTTLAQVILRLRQPSSGELLVNGASVDDFSSSSWYSRVGFVPQQPRLLRASVAENIAFMSSSFSRRSIEIAATRAGLSETVHSLPSGYDTVIGQGRHDLSGGQVQRIGIARALLRKPDLLVLDEPTSALDMESESRIQATLQELAESQEMILLIIAHRLSTLRACDTIVVVQGGELVAAGRPECVLNQSEFYRAAVNASIIPVGVQGRH